MTSPFVDNLLKPLALSRPPSPIPERSPNLPFFTAETESKKTLQSLLLELNSNQLSAAVVNDTLGTLIQIERSVDTQAVVEGVDAVEENALKQAIVNRLVVSLYAEGLEVCISQATQTEAEAEWWADIERSRRNVAWYLLQSKSFSVHLLLPDSMTI